ncbi:Abi-alpha family protein [Rhizobium sp. 2YAF20]|uniref:Abi-alpha family protein n=1 Tax=Rhizobium sp. 2YAF20 TaxID=3233027 RepID=UPI003F964CC8
MSIDPNTAVAAVEVAGKVAPKTFQEVDKFGADVVKTIRLLLAPFQLTAAWQDRLAAYIAKAIRQVPEPQRIPPVESVALPIVEKLRFQNEEDPITDLYVNLLSRAMDGHRVGEAHPAFFTVITQLAPDELLFLNDVATRYESIIMAPSGETVYPDPAQREQRLVELEFPTPLFAKVRELMFGYEKLNQPEMFPVYLEHLQHLGLIEYANRIVDELREIKDPVDGLRLFSIRPTHFGQLFLKACTKSGSDDEGV